jgi:hypothetical protein
LRAAIKALLVGDRSDALLGELDLHAGISGIVGGFEDFAGGLWPVRE